MALLGCDSLTECYAADDEAAERGEGGETEKKERRRWTDRIPQQLLRVVD